MDDPGQTRCVLICTSPNAGSGKRRKLVPLLEAALSDQGFAVRATSNIDQIVADAVEMHAGGTLACVVAAGGDGTLSLVAANLPRGIPVLPFPLGTENLMAKYLGILPCADHAFQTITQGKSVVIDAARAGEQLFLIMCSCGFDAEVVRRLHNRRSGHIWKLSYLWPFIRALFRYRFPKVCIVEPGLAQQPDPAAWAFVFNAPRYAAGLGIGAWADPTDGQLDTITLARGSSLSCFGYLFAVLRDKHRSMRGTYVGKTERLSLVPVDPNVKIPYQLDGDFAGYLPVDIAIEPARVTLRVPSGCQLEVK